VGNGGGNSDRRINPLIRINSAIERNQGIMRLSRITSASSHGPRLPVYINHHVNFLVPGLVKPGGRTCFIPSSSDRYKVARLAEKLQHPLSKLRV